MHGGERWLHVVVMCNRVIYWKIVKSGLVSLLLREIWISCVFSCIRVEKWKGKERSIIGFCFLVINSWVTSYKGGFFFLFFFFSLIKELGSDTSCTNAITLHYNFGDGFVGVVTRCWFFFSFIFSNFRNLVTVW
jgi:hypothetical protein